MSSRRRSVGLHCAWRQGGGEGGSNVKSLSKIGPLTAAALVCAVTLAGCGNADELPSSGGSDQEEAADLARARESGEDSSRFAGQEGYIDGVVAADGAGEIAFLEGPQGQGIVIAGVLDATKGGLRLVEELAAVHLEYDATPLEAFVSLSRSQVEDAPEQLLDHHFRNSDEAPRVLSAAAALRTQAVYFQNGYSANPDCAVFPMDYMLDFWIPNYLSATKQTLRARTSNFTGTSRDFFPGTVNAYGPNDYASWICGRSGEARWEIWFRQLWVFDWTQYGVSVPVDHGEHAMLWYVAESADPAWQVQTRVTNNGSGSMSYDISVREEEL